MWHRNGDRRILRLKAFKTFGRVPGVEQNGLTLTSYTLREKEAAGGEILSPDNVYKNNGCKREKKKKQESVHTCTNVGRRGNEICYWLGYYCL